MCHFRPPNYATLFPNCFVRRTQVVLRRSVKRKSSDHTLDDSVLRGRIRTEALFQTPKESEKLSNDNIDCHSIMVPKFCQAVALNRDVTCSLRPVCNPLHNPQLGT